MQFGVGCKTSLKWVCLNACCLVAVFISAWCSSDDIQIYILGWYGHYPEDTTDKTHEWTLIEENHNFHEERHSGLFLVVSQTLHGNILLNTLINFNFHFPTTLLIPQIAQFHLIICLLPVLNLLHLLSTSLLVYDLFVKFIQLFKSFLIVYSMTIFGKNFGFKICHFVFFSGSWSSMHIHYGYICFFTTFTFVPNDEN